MHYWREILGLFGLKESLGKTYFNRKFAVINSQHFDFADGRWTERQYVNMGLVKGLVRSGDVGEKTPPQVAECYNQLQIMTPDDLKERVNQLFFRYNSVVLKDFNGPWSLPTYAGGLGLRRDPSKFERMVLRRIQQCYCNCVRSWPMRREWEIRSLSEKLKRESWPLLSEYAYKRVLTFDDFSLEDSNIDVDIMFGWKAIFDNKMVDLQRDLQINLKKSMDEALRVNALLFFRASRDVKRDPVKPVEECFVWENRKRGFENFLVI
jgi:hypothetical protein